MNEKKPINVTNSTSQSKSIDKKQEISPILISYNKNNDEKNQEDNFIYYNNVQQCIQAIEQSSIPIFLILNSTSATDILSR
ncbi:unnamed protein product, partial [Rotaria sordida]